MGEGLIRALAATVRKSEHVKLMRQPDPLKVMVKCEHCGVVMTLDLPAETPVLTKFLKQCEKAHANCVKP